MKKVFIKIVFDDDPDVVLNYFPTNNGGTLKDLYVFVADQTNLPLDGLNKNSFFLHLDVDGRLIKLNCSEGTFLGEMFEYYEMPGAGPVHVTIYCYGDEAETFEDDTFDDEF